MLLVDGLDQPAGAELLEPAKIASCVESLGSSIGSYDESSGKSSPAWKPLGEFSKRGQGHSWIALANVVESVRMTGRQLSAAPTPSYGPGKDCPDSGGSNRPQIGGTMT